MAEKMNWPLTCIPEYTTMFLRTFKKKADSDEPIDIRSEQISESNSSIDVGLENKVCLLDKDGTLRLIMNRFVTLFPFLIRISPLRWQQVFGTGSAILAAFLALGGAAWSLDLPDVLCFNLFSAIYWSFIYVSIYIEISWGVYEKTKECIKKTWLFRKMKKAFTLERQALLFLYSL